MNKREINVSQLIYSFLLGLYPKNYRQEFGKEMEFVFTESLKDVYGKKGSSRILIFWLRTIADFCKSFLIQHLENQKGGFPMKNNKDILTVVLGTTGILAIPLVAMQFTSEVDWKLGDFIIMGTILLTFGFTYVAIARQVKNATHRLMIGAAFFLLLLYVWAELAVGIFTNLGS